MNFHVVTLFPQSFDSYISESIIARAIEDKKIKVNFYNPRDFSDNKFKHIDQKPYSGGPGMVIQAEPVIKAIEKAIKSIGLRNKRKAGKKTTKKTSIKIIFFSPGGVQFDTDYAKKTAKKYTDVIFICGRYEGIDARVKKVFKTGYGLQDVSVGPYVLTGGELPAMIVLDSVSRQIEGVLGNFNSLEESRVSSHDVYTRPEILIYNAKKYRVPKILLSGDRKKIEVWRIEQNAKKMKK